MRKKNGSHGRLLFPVILVVTAKIFAIAVIVEIMPPSSMGSLQEESGRDLSTPSSKLAGHWLNRETGQHLYFHDIQREHSMGRSTRLNADGEFIHSKFKMIREKSNEDLLIIRDFLPVRYGATPFPPALVDYNVHISKDGQSLTLERLQMESPHNSSTYDYICAFVPDHHASKYPCLASPSLNQAGLHTSMHRGADLSGGYYGKALSRITEIIQSE